MYIIKYIFWNFSKIQEFFSDSAEDSMALNIMMFSLGIEGYEFKSPSSLKD